MIEDPTTLRKLACIQELRNRAAHSPTAVGAIDSRVGFEERIVAIYQKCRTPEEISSAPPSLGEIGNGLRGIVVVFFVPILYRKLVF